MAVSFWQKVMDIDRRWIYLVIGIVTFVPILWYIGMPVKVTPEVKAVFDKIESLPPGSIVMVPMEFDPATAAELEPMAKAVVRHCFARNLKVMTTAFMIDGVVLVERDLALVAAEYGKEYGKDYVYLGYKPYMQIVLLNMGENFRKPFPRDYYGKKLDDLPMMQGVNNYSNISCIVGINATSGADYWINYASGRYGAQLALGVTAVMATDYYAFLQSGQIFGLMGGLKGAAEYEKLIGRPKDVANRSMDAVSVAHVFIILFIVIGNIAFFATGRQKKV
ncbi:MAG: hypothetical protein A2W25_00190 [candidate division Zixibacteria bacterium RBG_16_53_22]|nr:MAG: hypothetical protein A2W25_00190 [candidate division Zixibacteria bacterium RBG_16_53_22]